MDPFLQKHNLQLEENKEKGWLTINETRRWNPQKMFLKQKIKGKLVTV
jgi:hypothetical protein